MNAFAASAAFASVARPTEKTVTVCSSAGSGPTTSTPGTAISSGTCAAPSSMSPDDQHLAGLRAGVLVLGADLLGDPEALERPGERDARGAFLRVADRLRGEHGALERVGRADVGPGRARLHPDADAGPRDVDLAARHDLALLRQVLDDRAGQDEDVGRRALQEPGLEHRGETVGHRDLVAGLALELRDQLGGGRLHADGAEHRDLGGLGAAPRRQRQKRECQVPCRGSRSCS